MRHGGTTYRIERLMADNTWSIRGVPMAEKDYALNVYDVVVSRNPHRTHRLMSVMVMEDIRVVTYTEGRRDA